MQIRSPYFGRAVPPGIMRELLVDRNLGDSKKNDEIGKKATWVRRAYRRESACSAGPGREEVSMRARHRESAQNASVMKMFKILQIDRVTHFAYESQVYLSKFESVREQWRYLSASSLVSMPRR